MTFYELYDRPFERSKTFRKQGCGDWIRIRVHLSLSEWGPQLHSVHNINFSNIIVDRLRRADCLHRDCGYLHRYVGADLEIG